MIERFLAAGLTLLLALQPISLASSSCAFRAWAAGRAACCCIGSPAPAAERTASCCAADSTRDEASGPAVSAGGGRCSCAARPSEPLTALPHRAEGRQERAGAERAFERWLGEGAAVSAVCAVFFCGPEPPGRGSAPFPAPEPGRLQAAWDVLSVTCVARC
jgi:hypothetical protein